MSTPLIELFFQPIEDQQPTTVRPRSQLLARQLTESAPNPFGVIHSYGGDLAYPLPGKGAEGERAT